MSTLTGTQIDRLFPFHVSFDSSLQVVGCGRSLRKLLPETDRKGPLLDLIAIERPLLKEPSFSSIVQRTGSLFIWSLRHRALRLRGEVLRSDEGALFVGTPLVEDIATLTSVGLTLSDLALHDQTGEHLVMLRSLRTSNEENTKIAEKLRQEAALRESVLREREEQLQVIEQQRKALTALSVPIIQLWDRVLAVPIIGTVDAERAGLLMERLLDAVSQNRARYAILDVTGVATLTNDAARHFVRLLDSVRLIGGHGVLSGVGASLAKTMATLDVEMSGLQSFGSLRDALSYCVAQLESPRHRR